MKLVALAVTAVAVAAGVASAGSSQADVTLSLRQYTNANKVRVLVWYGQVASGAAGEHVEVLARDCGTKQFYRIAETDTGPGGGWEIQSQNPDPPYGSVRWSPGQAYRARWRDEQSRPVLFRLPFRPAAPTKIPGRRAWKLYVNTGDKDWTGKLVLLQRKRGAAWASYKQAKLVRKPSFKLGAYNHEVVFEAPARGLTLRAYLPAKSAAPCYSAGASEPFRS
jgi:hypothetical protein